MLLKQFEAKGLSHFSYAVGSKEKGEIAIIDPERDIQTYLEYAAENRLKIKYVLETHIHADFASGALELSQKTGAPLLLSGYDKGQKYEYAFEHKELKEGDKIDLGESVSLEVLHTPGHTPEHISFLGFDSNKSQDPIAIFSGDFLFIGSVGRPDLLGEDDKHDLAQMMYHSLKKLQKLPDDLDVFPAHGAGSLCGAGMSSAHSSTLKEERFSNPYLKKMSEKDFVDTLLGVKVPFPEYYLRMKKVNSEGPAILDGLPEPQPVTPEDFVDIVEDGKSVVLDVRPPLAFGGGHIDGAINIGMHDHVGFWGAWFIPYDRPIYLVLDDVEKVRHYVQALVRVGLDNVKGYLKPNFNSWVNRGNDFIDLPQVSVHGLNDFMEVGEKLTVVDVRSDNEYKMGHIKGAKHIYLGELEKNLKKLPKKDETIFCICGGGSRSSVAGSVLMKNGYENVYNVFGGMTAWNGACLPVEISEK